MRAVALEPDELGVGADEPIDRRDRGPVVAELSLLCTAIAARRGISRVLNLRRSDRLVTATAVPPGRHDGPRAASKLSLDDLEPRPSTGPSPARRNGRAFRSHQPVSPSTRPVIVCSRSDCPHSKGRWCFSTGARGQFHRVAHQAEACSSERLIIL